MSSSPPPIRLILAAEAAQPRGLVCGANPGTPTGLPGFTTRNHGGYTRFARQPPANLLAPLRGDVGAQPRLPPIGTIARCCRSYSSSPVAPFGARNPYPEMKATPRSHRFGL